MRKLEINYDLIDKIYESKGEHKISRTIKRYKMNDALTIGMIAKDVGLCLAGQTQPSEAVGGVSSWIIAYVIAVFGSDFIYDKLNELRTGYTREEEADKKLRELAIQLNNLNININLNELKQALVYYKKYKLKQEGMPGIIRERYIEVPIKDTDTNNDEKIISIKEEHVMGTRNYILSVDTPKKQLIYKPAYGM